VFELLVYRVPDYLLKFVWNFTDSQSMSERRTDARLLCADMVDVEWTDAQGKRRKARVLLEDISELGLCLQTEDALPESSIVIVDLNGTQTRAMVRYCYWREIGYFAGLTFASGSRWSRSKFFPRHLTDPLIVPPRATAFIV